MADAYYIAWVDSAYKNGWVLEETAQSLCLCQCETVAWVLAHDEDQVLIAQSLADGIVHGAFTIPRRAITAMVQLCVPNREGCAEHDPR